MGDLLPIRYSGFWDFPHEFWVCFEGDSYLFWRGHFDEEKDDYPDVYEVFKASGVSLNDNSLPWELSEIPAKVKIGSVKIRDVKFDPAHRRFIDSSIFSEILT
jgi:hypothetical protein